jgi:general secretion pathway protein G
MQINDKRAMKNKAFSLVELLIVVAIIGILAAMVMPEFHGHSAKAKEAAIKENLRILREAINRYAIQHNDVAPGYPNGDTSVPAEALMMIWQLLKYTNESGQTSDTRSAEYYLGPYLKEWPKKPFDDDWSVQILSDGEPFPLEATENYAYIYKPPTKQIRFNHPGTDSEGTRYYDY